MQNGEKSSIPSLCKIFPQCIAQKGSSVNTCCMNQEWWEKNHDTSGKVKLDLFLEEDFKPSYVGSFQNVPEER